MWSTFVTWFSGVIEWMYQLTLSMGMPSYGLAIILMTILIKLLMFPLTQKQLTSMRNMQELQPKLKYIQEKYKNDPKTMQAKTMEMYKENNASPFSGCLPLLIQMPIFIAFYQALYSFPFSNEAHASFLWIPNIGVADPFYIIALLAALTTFLQQRISMVSTQDQTQRMMLYVMPVMMGFIAFRLPAGLPLYWVIFNILGILQQLWVNYNAKKAAEKKALAKDKVLAEEEETLQVQQTPAGITDENMEEGSANSEKGGNDKNASPFGGKKGKKR